MDPMTISLIAGTVLGYYKDQEQRKAAAGQMKVEAQRQRYAGFTGDKGQTGKPPSSVDPMMQSMAAGAAMGQNLKKAGYGKKKEDDGGPTTAEEPMSNVQATGRQSSLAQSPYMSSQDNAQSMEQRYPWSVPQQDGGQ